MTMTVKELITKLENYSPKNIVTFEDGCDGSISLIAIDHRDYTRIEEIFNDEVVYDGKYYCQDFPMGINIYVEGDE